MNLAGQCRCQGCNSLHCNCICSILVFTPGWICSRCEVWSHQNTSLRYLFYADINRPYFNFRHNCYSFCSHFQYLWLYTTGCPLCFHAHVLLWSCLISFKCHTFGTDQLRDAPTRYSVRYIYAYFWSDSISKLIARVTYLPGHEIVINSHHNTIAIDKTRFIIMGAILSLSILSSTLILFLVLKKQRQWFLTENNRENRYKLVYNVIYFAVHHKKPIRRSAFTYCENERPSRLDFGKQRYGGPYTTEQVEDVNVMLNMLKIVFSLGPVFLLECSAASCLLIT